MGLFHRLLGLAAFFNEVTRSIRVYHIVRIDWIVVAVLLLYAFAGASALGLPWPKLPFEIPLAFPALQTAIALLALALIVTSGVRQDTIFRPMNVTARALAVPQSPLTDRPEPIDLRISGRFDRGFGRPVSLRDLPVQWKVDDTGSILLEAYVEEVHVGHGLPLFDSSALSDSPGYRSLIIPRETLIDGAQEGILYFGLRARPGLRLDLPARRLTAILSVRNASQMMILNRMFNEILKESAAKEADFFRNKLEANLEEPSPNDPTGAPKRHAKPGEEISWKDLIDFSP
jgi:hypothetical protein